ncbi:MAG: membrane protein insertion efficiency factor YidD [Patescibacteria group bacterium]
MSRIILFFLKIYQKTISPIPGSINPYLGCRFYPSCSKYSYQAVKKYGAIKGLFKAFKRIIRCHPFNKGGYDPC